MLTKRKKLKNRKEKLKKFSLIAAFFILLCISCGYLIYTKLFTKVNYISPLPTKASVDISNRDEKNIADVKSILSQQKIEFSSVKKSGDDYNIFLKENGVVIISSQKDIHTQIASLQFITFRLTMEGKRFSRLDLRFDKPIIMIN